MKYLLSILLIIAPLIVSSQGTPVLELSECIDKALKHYPTSGDSLRFTKISRLEAQNIHTGLYPQINFNANARYLSDVTDIGVESPLPGLEFPSPQNDQYNLTLDLNQVIYDGGIAHAGEELAAISGLLNKQKNKVELYKLRERVNGLYFTILFLQEKSELIKSTADQLIEKRKEVGSAVDYGVTTQSGLNLIEAEIIKLNQQFAEVNFSKSSGLDVLELYIDTLLPENIILKMPDTDVSYSGEIKRPEHRMFEYQLKQLSANCELVKARKRPKLSGFGQVGYGRPGLNYLNDEFDSFYVIGARFSWNIWDWNKTNRTKEQTKIKKELVRSQKNTFDKNLNIMLARARKEIQKWQVMIERDIDIIKLTSEVVKTSESQFKNGIITTSDLIRDINRRKEAEINMELHKIKLIESKTNYLTLKGW